MMGSLIPFLCLTLFLVIGADVVSSGESMPPIASFRPQFPLKPVFRLIRGNEVPRILTQRS